MISQRGLLSLGAGQSPLKVGTLTATAGRTVPARRCSALPSRHLCGPPVFEDCDEAVIIETGDAILKAAFYSLKPNHVSVLQEDREPSEPLVPLLQSADALVCVGEHHGSPYSRRRIMRAPS